MALTQIPNAPIVIVETSFTPNGTQYSSGDAFGGKLSFSPTPRRGVIQSVVLVDTLLLSPAVDLVLFDRPFTATADNAAFAPTDADAANIMGIISFATGNWATAFGANSAAQRSGIGLAYMMNPAGNVDATDNLEGQLVVRGTPDYGTTDTFTIRLFIIAG